MESRDTAQRTRIHQLDLPTEGGRSVSEPYVVMYSPNARGQMYLLLAKKSPSHTNMLEDLGHDADDPNIVGGGIIRMVPDGDAWKVKLEAGSHYDAVPAEVQERFALKIKRALEKKGMKVSAVDTLSSPNERTNAHWEAQAVSMS